VFEHLDYKFFFNDTATTEIYTSTDTLSLHDALPISSFVLLVVSKVESPDSYKLASV